MCKNTTLLDEEMNYGCFYVFLEIFPLHPDEFSDVYVWYLGEPQKVLREGAVRIVHFYDGQLLFGRHHDVIIFIKHTRYVQTPTDNMQ